MPGPLATQANEVRNKLLAAKVPIIGGPAQDPSAASYGYTSQADSSRQPKSSESELILSVRGAFYRVSLTDNRVSPGIYAIDELNQFLASQASVDEQGLTLNPVLLNTIEFSQMDITSEMPCLGNAKIFYTFGQNFGQVVISGEMLLGALGESESQARGFKMLRDFFWNHRVSVRKSPITVSVASEAYFVYLKGMKIGQIDPNYHTLPFVFFGTLLDINREDASNINPASNVITEGTLNTPSLISAIQATTPKELVLSTTEPTDSTTTSTAGSGTSGTTAKDKTTLPKMTRAGYVKSASALLMKNKGDKSGMTQDLLLYQATRNALKQENSDYAQLKADATPATTVHRAMNPTPAFGFSGNEGTDVKIGNSDEDTLLLQAHEAKVVALTNASAKYAERAVREDNGETLMPLENSAETAKVLKDYGIDPAADKYDPFKYKPSNQLDVDAGAATSASDTAQAASNVDASSSASNYRVGSWLGIPNTGSISPSPKLATPPPLTGTETPAEKAWADATKNGMGNWAPSTYNK